MQVHDVIIIFSGSSSSSFYFNIQRKMKLQHDKNEEQFQCMPGLPEGLQVQQAGHPVLTILCQLADKKK